MRLENKFVVVTGGASGIGAAAARLFAAEGATVAVIDSQPGGIVCDVSNEAAVRAAFQQIRERFGRLDVLFNSAGVAVRHPAGEEDQDNWDRVFAVNVRGAWLCSREALPLFPESGGSIVHTASVTGITGVRNRAAYSSSKGAIVALTRNMALDYAARRIRVNCVCPGFVKTPLVAGLLKDPVRAARVTGLHPLGRLGEPEDVARAVLFLASGESSWITGHALVVDGGFSAGHAADI